MLIGKVINSIWSTRKDESLKGAKFMIVQLQDTPEKDKGRIIVALDMIGAGIGERVLITQGSSARRMPNFKDAPIDATIVGIIDEDQQDV
ncbi:EutN/CcmL family microcompartment protein [Dehalobacterium formicoaceticum]|uniref:EutN/CcmL family microcompartment protein n=1 Tax=Dehalobacterium formicoaceticum TaxID=51515 RepID=A0ABT1Y225_9FIRM|nr:EutN/CcmL family microcompartment protein [Dehalobacterium formicoaceticum]MCR6544904.1 EutN/CcmL family microcompartment protein [Dehalobacterium formicoaceticum]